MPNAFSRFIDLACKRQQGIMFAMACTTAVSATQVARAQNVPLSFSGVFPVGQNQYDQCDFFGGISVDGYPYTVDISYNVGQLSEIDPGAWEPTVPGAITESITINGAIKWTITSGSTFDQSGIGLNQQKEIFTSAGNPPVGRYYPELEVYYPTPSGTPTLTNPSPPQGVLNTTIFLTGVSPTTDQYCSDVFFGTAGSISTISPFLLGAKDLGNLDLATLLPKLTAADSATALAADGTSAAIVLFQVPTMDPVTFTTNNGTTLLPWDPNFLQNSPSQGVTTLPSVTPISIGSSIYAVALLQSPTAGVTPGYSTPITITAQQQGGQVQQSYLPLVPPPVLLVHGLWGDLTSLSNLESFLTTQAPWNSDPNLVQPICYSKFLEFDAKTDPLAKGQECEWTSNVGLKTEITPILDHYQSEGVVVGRVDVVTHSMGGLAARNYASQPSYRSLVDRKQGQFHTIVTLDTPETGSDLATFLIDNRDASRQRAGDAIWSAFCHLRSGPLEKCFDVQGLPINAPGVPLKETAVFSLEPNSPSLSRKGLVGPNVTDSIWRAVAATAPDNSALEGLLNDLMTEITPEGQNPPTVSGELGTTSHDSIVTTQSQTAGASGGQISMFSGLSHTSTMLPKSLIKLNKWDDNSVLNDPTGAVNQTVVCLLQSAGAAACTPPHSQTTRVVNSPRFGNSSAQAEYSLKVQVTNHAELGRPIDVSFRGVQAALLKEITVNQDEKNRLNKGCSQTVPVDRLSDGMVYVRITPCVLGNATISVEAEAADGTLGEGNANVLVLPPETPPASFKVSAFNRLFIDLDDHDSMLPTYPTARFVGLADTYRIPSQFLSYDLAPGSATSVIIVGRHGLIRGLSEGKAVVEAHLGRASDKVEVVVQRRPPNPSSHPTPAP